MTAVLHLSIGEQPDEYSAGDAKCEPPKMIVDVAVKREDADTACKRTLDTSYTSANEMKSDPSK